MPTSRHWQAAETAARTFAGDWTAETPGGAIVGFDAGGIRFAVSGGVESLSTLRPFTPDTVSRYASVTKHFLASHVLLRPDIISLDDTLGSLLPELQPALAAVTVGRALDMSGGLPDVREAMTLHGHSIYTATTGPELIAYCARFRRLNFETGTEISYSNTGTRLIEAGMERRGAFLDAFLQSEICAPLGIFLKAPDIWTDPVPGLAPGYWKSADGTWHLGTVGLHLSAAGSIAGSAVALATWLGALLRNEGRFRGLLEALSQPRFLNDGTPMAYALGLQSYTLGNRRFIGHSGSNSGYVSQFMLDPETKQGLAVVCNRDDVNLRAIALGTLSALTGEPLPKPSRLIPDGFYVTGHGPFWLEVKGETCIYLDSENPLFENDAKSVSSRASASPLVLRLAGDALDTEIGLVKRRFLPVTPQPAAGELDGEWNGDDGARFVIHEGQVLWGIGPVRRVLPLMALGNGRYLFTLKDGPWTKRILIHRLGADHIELVLSRARMIEYRRG